MQNKSKTQQDDNDGIHIDKIVSAVPCGRHAADIGQACWYLDSARGVLKAICDRRARSAGANGQISHSHIQKKEYTR